MRQWWWRRRAAGVVRCGRDGLPEAWKDARQTVAVPGRREVLGDKHPETLDSIAALARLLQDESKLDEADALLREAMNGRHEVLGSMHRDTLDAYHKMAMLLQDQGKLSIDMR